MLILDKIGILTSAFWGNQDCFYISVKLLWVLKELCMHLFNIYNHFLITDKSLTRCAKPQTCHELTVGFWAYHLTLHFIFLTSELRIFVKFTLRGPSNSENLQYSRIFTKWNMEDPVLFQTFLYFVT